EAAVGAQVADGERQLGGGQVARAVGGQNRGADAVGHVDTGGVMGEVLGGQVQDRVGQVGVVAPALVLEPADVVGDDDVEGFDAGETLLEVLTVALDGGAERPEIHAVGTDADGAAAATGAEGNDLVKAVQQAGPLARLD